MRSTSIIFNISFFNVISKQNINRVFFLYYNLCLKIAGKLLFSPSKVLISGISNRDHFVFLSFILLFWIFEYMEKNQSVMVLTYSHYWKMIELDWQIEMISDWLFDQIFYNLRKDFIREILFWIWRGSSSSRHLLILVKSITLSSKSFICYFSMMSYVTMFVHSIFIIKKKKEQDLLRELFLFEMISHEYFIWHEFF